MREIYQCTGCQAKFREGEVKPVYLRNPEGGPCGKLSQIPEGPSRRRISTATATVLGMVAALAPEPPPRPSIGGQEQCTNCGRVEGHAPDCRPPRGVRKV